MIDLLGDTPVTPSVRVGLAVVGAFLSGLAEDASPADDTPHVITQEEKLSRLGKAAMSAVGGLSGK